MKTGKLQECEDIFIQLLKLNSNEIFMLYFLAHFMLQLNKADVAILVLRILTKLQPNNYEFWIILTMLYKKICNKAGIEYCKMKIHGTNFVPEHHLDVESITLPEIFNDEITQILSRQLKLELFHFFDLTKKFLREKSVQFKSDSTRDCLQVCEWMMKEGKRDAAMELTNTVEITTENEAILRILKVNLLFADDGGCNWKAICEYEQAYTICSESGSLFPTNIAVICGEWFLNEMKNLSKALRYFNYAYQKAATFRSLMGLGQVSYEEMNYQVAEKYFAEANEIDRKSGNNWLYLAMTNYFLKHFGKFEKCFRIARKLNIQNLKLLKEAENILDF